MAGWYSITNDNRARHVFFARRLAAVILLLMAPTPSFPQTFGLKFAYPNADVFQSNPLGSGPFYAFHARPIKFGATGELPFRQGLLVEFDAIYSRLSYASTTADAGVLTQAATAVNCWDFFALLKKEFLHNRFKPFIDGGAAFQAVDATSNMTTPAFPSAFRPPEFIHQAVAGFAVGGGIDFKIGRFHLEPEFRYVGLADRNFQAPAGSFQSNLRQPMFMLGLQTGFGANR